MRSPLRLRSTATRAAAVTALAAAAVACGSSSGGAGPPPDSGAATPCADTLANVFAASTCPADPTTNAAVGYDSAITTTCAQQHMNAGAIQYGQCLDFLVWEQDNDSSGHNFSKCFYDVRTHALVGIVFDDGAQDQCNKRSFTVQAGTTQPYCTISGLTTGGGGGYQSCAPAVVDAGGVDAPRG